MDFMDVFLGLGLVTLGLATYLTFRRQPKKKGNYSGKGWNYPFKYLTARYAVNRWKSNLPPSSQDESPREDQVEGQDAFMIRASAPEGTFVYLGIKRWCGRKGVAEVTLHVQLEDGTVYKLLSHPETAIGAWESADGWSAGGLKLQVIEPNRRLRVLFNGLLREGDSDVTRHVRINLIWASSSRPVRHPQDWGSALAAQALASEAWRDETWPQLLDRWGDGSSLQWGAIQGRIQAYDSEGGILNSSWVRCRGTKERSWAPHGYLGVHRTVNLTVAAQDGTMVNLKAVAYKDVLTQTFSGCVRFPNSDVESITSTDLSLRDFCESRECVLDCYTINVTTTSKKSVRVFIRPQSGGHLLSGVPHQQELSYRTLIASVDGDHATGLLELGYQAKVPRQPAVPLTPRPTLHWSSDTSADYCLRLDSPPAACPALVGGKAASLALLSTVASTENYVVPPAYCLTTHALAKQMADNPQLRRAIDDIDAASQDETAFKDKCNRASELFSSTEITQDVKEAILSHLRKLREDADRQNFGPDLRFAVRSSGVGEDGEALSAAGQNATVLGCAGDDDVTRAVSKCWGSMFAYNSAHYRRQNGQPLRCGGGVVVQVLAKARVAGVLFSRHPASGDPSRLLVTANYGLGETVVSGSVEPDTFIISRDATDRLAVIETTLGTKTERILATDTGVKTETVTEEDRKKACLNYEEVLKLGELAVRQETLWGAPRDIEWAFVREKLYLLQARPITSLEQWSEEELLHEMDSPIMSDEDLATFANVGEVMPKCLSPLSIGLMLTPLTSGMARVIRGASQGDYDSNTLIVTHQRASLTLYQSIYRTVPPKIDIGIKMLEMAVHGHKVADDKIYSVALKRSPPSTKKKLVVILRMVKALYNAKTSMNDTKKAVKEFKIDEIQTNNPMELLNQVENSLCLLERCMSNHAVTSSASTSSQVIAMSVLLEGAEDFTPEHCQEIGLMLSSGDAVSAEVPNGLSRLARTLENSGKAEQFRTLKTSEALKWLEGNCPELNKEVQEFLKEHGHRSLMEFDLATKPWGLEPDQLMDVLQKMRVSNTEGAAIKSDAEVIASLKTPQKTSTRKILSYLLPLCRRYVVYRESTKAHAILAIHKVRLALRKLGKLLVKEWYLPLEELVFYFRLDELKSFIQTRDPVLLRKATQRRQFFPNWNKLKFDEMQIGWPAPRAPHAPRLAAAGAKIKATPVAGGDVVARACVIRDLSEIGELKHGDILVTHSTDIGWSPYFPLIAGIVTELGGLISHGAVIARECGLPCIVGAGGATSVFQTGDLLRLSGATGILEKVARAEDKQATEGDQEVSA